MTIISIKKSLFGFTLLTSLFFQTYAHATLRNGVLECSVLRPISQGFLTHHVLAGKEDLNLEGKTIEQFIKRLDPSKVYLLESDVQEIRTKLRGIFKNFGENCEPIEKAQALLNSRYDEAVAFVVKELGDKFKFDENTELMIDSNLREFPKNKEQQETQLRKFIQFQISNYLASDTKLPEAKKQLIHRYQLNAKRQKETTKDELYTLFLDSFASALDAHSNYLSKDMLEEFEIQMRLSLEGIGAALTWEDGYTTVESLIPGGSAERSGELLPKDKIISVAQGAKDFEQVIDMPLRDVVKLIRGKKGTTVRLTVLRQSSKESSRHIISLIRDKINLQDEAAKLTMTTKKVGDRTLKIGVLDLPSFYGDLTKRTRSCYEDVKKLVLQAKKQKVDGLIFDLSKNGGGLLTEAVRIGGLFIGSGNIVATQASNTKLELLPDEDEAVQYDGPLVVLTSRLSASASEIVSGALQDYHRAVIVGSDHTFGKGSVQAMMNLPADLGAIKVTTGMFFVPGGQSTQYRGVPADIEIPSIFSTKEIGERSLDNSLPPKSIPAFISESANPQKKAFAEVTSSLVSKLKSASEKRVEKDAEFAKIKKELEEMEKKKGMIKLSDSLKKQKEEKKDPKKALAKKGRKSKRESDEEYLKTPQVKEAISVLSDMITMK